MAPWIILALGGTLALFNIERWAAKRVEAENAGLLGGVLQDQRSGRIQKNAPICAGDLRRAWRQIRGTKIMEGPQKFQRLVVIELPKFERAGGCFKFDEYKKRARSAGREERRGRERHDGWRRATARQRHLVPPGVGGGPWPGPDLARRMKIPVRGNAGGNQMLDNRFGLLIGATLMSAVAATPSAAQSREPIKIGYGISMTGGLAPNGKSALLAQKIWEEDINAKGGLLGRPVKLVYYDDQTKPDTVPGIYAKLIDVDKVDLIIGGYGTNMLAPAMPMVIQKKKMMIGLFGMAVNSDFNYPKYFSMIPLGPTPKPAMTTGFFDIAMAQNPKPQTVAIVAADAEFSINASDGARENAAKHKLKVVYDKRYPPATTDFTPIVRAIQASNPDLVVICSYPPDSVGMVKAVNEVGLKPKMIGGGMVGLQATVFKTQLGPLLNGFTNYDFWLPIPKMEFPGVAAFMKKYQARAPAEGVDPLGFYIAPWGYAQLEVLGQAVTATKSLDDEKLTQYIAKTTFKTMVGDVKFGAKGEWVEPRVLQVQFQNIKGNDLGQFKDTSTQVVVSPAGYASGKVIYPYENAKK